MQKISILGFGNPVREDDGVGIFVVDELKKRIDDPNIEIIDMGTSAFEILFRLQGRDKIILIDAVINTGEAVGTLFKLPASEIDAQVQDDPLVFLHRLKWDQALSYAKKIFPDDLTEDIHAALCGWRPEEDTIGVFQAAGAQVSNFREGILAHQIDFTINDQLRFPK